MPRGWTRSFAFPIARFVLPFFVSHLTVCSSFAAFNFLRSSLRSLLAFSFSFFLALSLSLFSSSSRHDRTEESLRGGVNEAARLSHGRSASPRQTGPFSSSCWGEPSYLCELRRVTSSSTSSLSMRPRDIISVTSPRYNEQLLSVTGKSAEVHSKLAFLASNFV